MTNDDIEKKFGLVTTIKKTNMHFFDHEERIRKYTEPEEILKDFFPYRLNFYERRKQFMLDQLGDELQTLLDKARFVQLIIDGKIVLSNKRKDVLMEELRQHGFRSSVPSNRREEGLYYSTPRR